MDWSYDILSYVKYVHSSQFINLIQPAHKSTLISCWFSIESVCFGCPSMLGLQLNAVLGVHRLILWQLWQVMYVQVHSSIDTTCSLQHYDNYRGIIACVRLSMELCSQVQRSLVTTLTERFWFIYYILHTCQTHHIIFSQMFNKITYTDILKGFSLYIYLLIYSYNFSEKWFTFPDITPHPDVHGLILWRIVTCQIIPS